MKKLVYIGCFITFIMFNIPYGPLFCILNVMFYILSAFFLIQVLNAGASKEDWMDEVNPQILVILAIFGIGPILAGYHYYQFYKRPIHRNETEDEYESRVKMEKRNKILNKIGI